MHYRVSITYNIPNDKNSIKLDVFSSSPHIEWETESKIENAATRTIIKLVCCEVSFEAFAAASLPLMSIVLELSYSLLVTRVCRLSLFAY